MFILEFYSLIIVILWYLLSVHVAINDVTLIYLFGLIVVCVMLYWVFKLKLSWKYLLTSIQSNCISYFSYILLVHFVGFILLLIVIWITIQHHWNKDKLVVISFEMRYWIDRLMESNHGGNFRSVNNLVKLCIIHYLLAWLSSKLARFNVTI